MITSITKDIKSVNIECIQMHNLSRNDNVLSGASGDFNITGATDQQDYEDLNQHLLYPTQYISEGQLYNCDMNADKVIDSNDLAILNEVLNPDAVTDLDGENGIIIDSYNYMGEAAIASPYNNVAGIKLDDPSDVYAFIQKGWIGAEQTNQDEYDQGVGNVGDGINFLRGDGANIFRNNPDAFNISNVSTSDNETIMQQLTPNGLYLYSGTGDNLYSYNGWYMKIGEEWVQVIESDILIEIPWNPYSGYMYSQTTLRGISLLLRRGQLGSTVSAHSTNDVVKIYSSEPSSADI